MSSTNKSEEFWIPGLLSDSSAYKLNQGLKTRFTIKPARKRDGWIIPYKECEWIFKTLKRPINSTAFWPNSLDNNGLRIGRRILQFCVLKTFKPPVNIGLNRGLTKWIKLINHPYYSANWLQTWFNKPTVKTCKPLIKQGGLQVYYLNVFAKKTCKLFVVKPSVNQIIKPNTYEL